MKQFLIDLMTDVFRPESGVMHVKTSSPRPVGAAVMMYGVCSCGEPITCKFWSICEECNDRLWSKYGGG